LMEFVDKDYRSSDDAIAVRLQARVAHSRMRSPRGGELPFGCRRAQRRYWRRSGYQVAGCQI
jgi:hypothetical protein